MNINRRLSLEADHRIRILLLKDAAMAAVCIAALIAAKIAAMAGIAWCIEYLHQRHECETCIHGN